MQVLQNNSNCRPNSLKVWTFELELQILYLTFGMKNSSNLLKCNLTEFSGKFFISLHSMSNGILGSCNVLLSYSKDEDVRLKSFCVQVSRRQDLKFFLHFQDPKSLAGLPANLVSLMSKGQLGATKLTEVSKPKIDTETPAQKQAAAKLALRKQLEKTLLQV